MWAGFISLSALALLVTLVFVAFRVDDSLAWSWLSVFWPLYVLYAAMLASACWPCCRYSDAYASRATTRAHRERVRDDDESDSDEYRERASLESIDRSRALLSTESPYVVFTVVELALLAAATITLGAQLEFSIGWALPLALAIAALALWLVAVAVSAFRGVRSASLLSCCRPHGDALHEAPPVCCGGYPKVSAAHVIIFNVSLWLLGVATIVTLALLIRFLDAGEPAAAATHVLVPLWIGIGLVLAAGVLVLGVETMSAKNYAFDLSTLAVLLVALAFGLVSSILVLHADTLSVNGVFWPLYVGLALVIVFYGLVQCFQCWRYDTFEASATRVDSVDSPPRPTAGNWDELLAQ